MARMGGAPITTTGSRTPVSSITQITGPGNYIATADFGTDGNDVYLQINNVDLDMDGRAIGITGTGNVFISGPSYGEASGIIVRNALFGRSNPGPYHVNAYGNRATTQTNPPAIQFIGCTFHCQLQSNFNNSNIVVRQCQFLGTSYDDSVLHQPLSPATAVYYCQYVDNHWGGSIGNAHIEGNNAWAYFTFTGNIFEAGTRSILGEYGGYEGNPSLQQLCFGIVNSTITGNTMPASGETMRFSGYIAASDAYWNTGGGAAAFTAPSYSLLGISACGKQTGYNVISGNTYV
jgi:hypothetical protein